MSKPLKILAGRSGMLGDTVSALVIPRFFRKLYPDAHIVWPIGRRFSQGAPLYLNHPDLTEIFILDGEEKTESKRDWDMVNSCDIVINPAPEHPDNIYPSQRTIYEESFLMAGFSRQQWESLSREDQRPKLYKWWKEIKAPNKTVAYFPQAGYGAENKRNASFEWRKELIKKLSQEGYEIWQLGAEKDDDYAHCDIPNLQRFNHLSFFEQIRLALSTNLMIGTDSGSALAIGAYSHPQISLLVGHWRKDQNPHALEVDNPNNFSFYDPVSADNISVDSVVTKINDMLS